MYIYTILPLFKHNSQENLLTQPYTNHVIRYYISVDHNHNKIKMSIQDRNGFKAINYCQMTKDIHFSL